MYSGIKMLAASLALLLPFVATSPRPTPSYASTLPIHAQSMFTESMEFMDYFYDQPYGYLYEVTGNMGGRHETRSSVWYAIGLLARNEGDDVSEAEKIITKVIESQFKDPDNEWFGDYQQEPEEPEVGSPVYSDSAWDPNWRGFIGTAFILGIEEFGHLLSPEVTDLLLESLRNNTIGDTYRNDIIELDNFHPGYSNPWIMRCFVSSWTGNRLNDSNMTISGEQYAKQLLDLFDENNQTLSEFNSGTYYGVSLWALVLCSKYLPKDAILGQRAPDVVAHVWRSIAELWHPHLLNLAGPWDRTYGYDMQKYVALVAFPIWGAVGKSYSSIKQRPGVIAHHDDFEMAPLHAIVAETHNSLIPEDVKAALQVFKGEHTYNASIRYPPYDIENRNVTAWLANNISIGAQSWYINSSVPGGKMGNMKSYAPGVIQWRLHTNEIGWILPQVVNNHTVVEASPGTLTVTYPEGNNASSFSFIVSQFAEKPTVTSLDDIQGLSVNVSGTVNASYEISFGGSYGGAHSVLNTFEYWNFTWTMPQDSSEVPAISLHVSLE
ncbi:uncharacterized protein ColSpa_11621 [Colletotrichum spaethianum]|uniref:Uncharacterized protein n=1 Tax=Colletotrichum spaethianum TaxID=700344 RepID=A0AA37PFP1_9PEZI|nr:uncharacterized protein ColSpa_11621 [Colletotrichum spaethianum]GKT51440.1 hypothetical protein ColSpa_11621 [Colletotrichum spaethianum]